MTWQTFASQVIIGLASGSCAALAISAFFPSKPKRMTPEDFRRFLAEAKPATFTVTAKDSMVYFPFDMLRAGRCWPAATEDSVKIDSSCKSYPVEGRKITLATFNYPDVVAWDAFGWTVGEINL